MPMPMPTSKNMQTAVMIISVLYFAYLIQYNMELDADNYMRLSGQVSHKQVIVPNITFEERIKIESVIEDYKKKKTMNKSNINRIVTGIRDGMIRGALGGAFMGKSVEGSILGAIVFGSMGGIMKAHSLVHDHPYYLYPEKFT